MQQHYSVPILIAIALYMMLFRGEKRTIRKYICLFALLDLYYGTNFK